MDTGKFEKKVEEPRAGGLSGEKLGNQIESGSELVSGGESNESLDTGKVDIKISPTQSAIPASNDLSDEQSVKEVERALEAGLEDVFKSLDPVNQIRFKAAGENAARQINVLLKQTKVNIKKIVEIIVQWLRMVPGINRFFLEQEAKIKADEILKIKKQI